MVWRKEMAGRQLSITIMIILVDVLNDGNGLALTPRIRVYLPLMVEGNTFQESYKQTRDLLHIGQVHLVILREARVVDQPTPF